MRDMILNNILKYKNKFALISEDKQITYIKFKDIIMEKISWYKKYFSDYVVGIVEGNTIEVVVLLVLALLTKGKVVLLGNNLKKSEFEYYVEKLEIQKIFISESKKNEFRIDREDKVFFGTLSCLNFGEKKASNTSYKMEDYIIQLTSGSEGVSKVVARSENSLRNEIINTCKDIDFQNDEVFMTIPPIYHSYGLVLGILLPLYMGKTIVLMNKFDPNLVENYLIKYEVNVLVGVPFIYHILCRRIGIETIQGHSLTKCFSAGGNLEYLIWKKFKDIMGIAIWNDYGSTETGVICIEKEGVFGSVGKPISGITLFVLNSSGEPVDKGESGIIYVKGESMARGYVMPESLNKSKYLNAMYCTGDVGILDENGYVYLKGRVDDFLVIGGEKTSVKEIEKIILGMEGVKDVAVISKKHPIIGDIISAFIVCEPGSNIGRADLLRYCNANMPEYKIPKEVNFIDEISRNSNGKILKKYLLNNGE